MVAYSIIGRYEMPLSCRIFLVSSILLFQILRFVFASGIILQQNFWVRGNSRYIPTTSSNGTY